MAVLCGLLSCRYFPARGKASEMIQTDYVDESHSGSDAIDPPFKTIGLHSFPVIHRIAPQLSRRAEIIRRHSCYDSRSSFFVQFELMWIRPNVGRIECDIYRHVADDFYIAIRAMPF